MAHATTGDTVLASGMTAGEFIEKWRAVALNERAVAHEHFLDLCRLLGEETPVEADPHQEWYRFEKVARKDSGGGGWADVWKRGHFAWEYKSQGRDLDAAFQQLRQYALALENPPLLIVSDMRRFRIYTNWTNSIGQVHEFTLYDLDDADTWNKLKWAFSDPERLRPEQTRQTVTEQAAATFADLALKLRNDHDRQEVARFVIRLAFCMFAEDMRLLPDQLFRRLLDTVRRRPEQFAPLASELFARMASGGMFGVDDVPWFNGGLFDEDSKALPLDRPGIEIVREAAGLDWSEIDASVLGTLFERGLDPDKRSQLGAHYTDADKIMRIVEPVIVRPWLAEWERTKELIAHEMAQVEPAGAGGRRRQRAERTLREFLGRLREFRVLDPACGSGNFLYLALRALKDLEHRVQLEAHALGLGRQFPSIGPSSVKGIEINPYAAELAHAAVWIGEIQWMQRNGFGLNRRPILDDLESIEHRDAVLTEDGEEPEWPAADVVIGNPPFLGDRVMRDGLGHAYTERLRRAYQGSVPASADLVCYWFFKAGDLVAQSKVARAGLVATNSIRGGNNRAVLDRIVKQGAIFDAWSDEPWVIDGAAVRVSLICFGSKDSNDAIHLNGAAAECIHADLTEGSVDITQASRLDCNQGVAFLGVNKNGAFDIPGDLAREWLRLPSNPNGQPNSDVLKPRVIGRDLTRRPSDGWIVDFGSTMSEADAALYEAPFAYVADNVKPVRQRNRIKRLREEWWRHWRPRPAMWQALDGLSRYIATPTMARHRLFAWYDRSVCPDHQLIVIARDDDTTFGILHSRFHELWSLRLGTWLGVGNDPRYTPTTTFQTFPFPEGLSPDIPAVDYADDPRAIAIAEAARRLVERRDRWLNPPEWVEWVDEPVTGYPKRPVPTKAAPVRELGRRTLTNLYNERPQWLTDAHGELDVAVAAAYTWKPDAPDTEALEQLLRLNLKRQL